MDNLQRLIDLNIEIEGLLRVYASRQESNQDAKKLIQEKFTEYSTIFNATFAPSAVDVVTEDITTELPITEEITAEETITELPINKEENAPVKASIPYSDAKAAEEAPLTETIVILDASAAPAPQECEEPKGADTPLFISGDAVRIDQKLSFNEAKDLTRAFTINDKYRFIREIFDNNKQYFTHTIEAVALMENFDDAYNYLISHKGLDIDNETVRDFMSIIANHFNTNLSF